MVSRHKQHNIRHLTNTLCSKDVLIDLFEHFFENPLFPCKDESGNHNHSSESVQHILFGIIGRNGGHKVHGHWCQRRGRSCWCHGGRGIGDWIQGRDVAVHEKGWSHGKRKDHSAAPAAKPRVILVWCRGCRWIRCKCCGYGLFRFRCGRCSYGWSYGCLCCCTGTRERFNDGIVPLNVTCPGRHVFYIVGKEKNFISIE